MFPHFPHADLPMTHPAHVVNVCGVDAMQAVLKHLIIAQKLNNYCLVIKLRLAL